MSSASSNSSVVCNTVPQTGTGKFSRSEMKYSGRGGALSARSLSLGWPPSAALNTSHSLPYLRSLRTLIMQRAALQSEDVIEEEEDAPSGEFVLKRNQVQRTPSCIDSTRSNTSSFSESQPRRPLKSCLKKSRTKATDGLAIPLDGIRNKVLSAFTQTPSPTDDALRSEETQTGSSLVDLHSVKVEDNPSGRSIADGVYESYDSALKEELMIGVGTITFGYSDSSGSDEDATSRTEQAMHNEDSSSDNRSAISL